MFRAFALRSAAEDAETFERDGLARRRHDDAHRAGRDAGANPRRVRRVTPFFLANLEAKYAERRDHEVPAHRQDCGVRKQYHFRTGELGRDAWDVDRLVELSCDLPVIDIALATIAEIDSEYWFDDEQRPTVRNVVDHVRLVRDVDVEYPIILAPDGAVMDGMHRVARAMLEGRTTIRAVRLATLPEPDYRNCRPSDLPYD